MPLHDAFPSLFAIATWKDALIKDVWNPIEGRGGGGVFGLVCA